MKSNCCCCCRLRLCSGVPESTQESHIQKTHTFQSQIPMHIHIWLKKNTLRCKTLINAETVGKKKRQTHSSNLPHTYGHAHKHARTHEEYQTQTHTLDALLITANRTQINSIQHSTGCIVHKSMLIGWAMEPKNPGGEKEEGCDWPWIGFQVPP